MVNWKDVRNSIETGQDISPIPDGAKMYPVVGLTFVPGYPGYVHNLHKALRQEANIQVDLVRNPENKYDSNAIEVRNSGRMLGHLPRDVAAELAPLIDSGKEFKASVYQVRVSPDNPNNPGLDILVEG